MEHWDLNRIEYKTVNRDYDEIQAFHGNEKHYSRLKPVCNRYGLIAVSMMNIGLLLEKYGKHLQRKYRYPGFHS